MMKTCIYIQTNFKLSLNQQTPYGQMRNIFGIIDVVKWLL